MQRFFQHAARYSPPLKHARMLAVMRLTRQSSPPENNSITTVRQELLYFLVTGVPSADLERFLLTTLTESVRDEDTHSSFALVDCP